MSPFSPHLASALCWFPSPLDFDCPRSGLGLRGTGDGRVPKNLNSFKEPGGGDDRSLPGAVATELPLSWVPAGFICPRSGEREGRGPGLWAPGVTHQRSPRAG